MIYARHKSQFTGLIFVAVLSLLFFVSCDEDDGDGTNGPGPTALVSGTVRDVGGEPIECVGIHVIYEIEGFATIDSVGLSSHSPERPGREEGSIDRISPPNRPSRTVR